MTRNQGKILAVVVVVALVVLVALSACAPKNKGNVFDKIHLVCSGPCELDYYSDNTGREVKTEGLVKALEIFPPLNR